MNSAQTVEKKAKKVETLSGDVAETVRDKVEQVRDIVENVRDKAEVTFRERPYLVPVAAGAVGFGVGLLFGSKLTRFLVVTAVGGLLSETIGSEIKRMAGEFMSEFQNRLTEGETASKSASSDAEE